MVVSTIFDQEIDLILKYYGSNEQENFLRIFLRTPSTLSSYLGQNEAIFDIDSFRIFNLVHRLTSPLDLRFEGADPREPSFGD